MGFPYKVGIMEISINLEFSINRARSVEPA